MAINMLTILTSIAAYTLYEGLSLANQKTRKLRVICRNLEGSHSRCYFILMKIRENVTIIFQIISFSFMHKPGIRIIIHNLEIIAQEAKPKLV